MSVQCSDCHFKYQVRTNLGDHFVMKHGKLEEVVTEIKLENNKEETNNEANARKVGNYEL